eukprot:TRINITY_DN2850_c0_g1_i1.p1 TRINITY_DN2850_c0_g1~~TRINITY_DN2850_c0_g1_i1.p1  ORF type:complete len:445 (-),score=-3.38 TRINITY_DN2850_c0_g1_i1:57-1391(-)
MTISLNQIQIQRKSLPWKLIFIILSVNMYIVNGSFKFAPDACASNKDCITCADIGGCEWCSSTLTCLQTNSKSANCTLQCTVTASDVCPKTTHNCSAIANCSTCAAHGCAWCRETHKCYEPSNDGKDACTKSGLCDCSVVTPAMCPISKMKCSEHKNCSTCTPDPSCGWCSSTGKCLDARLDGTGPCLNGSCPKYWNYKNCSEQCRSYDSCDGCSVDPDCSWCSGGAVPTFDNEPLRTSFCVYGKINEFTHHCLAWHNVTCPDCQKFNSCNTCVDNLKPEVQSCGWCCSSSKCYEGNALGPFDEFDCTSNWTMVCPTEPPTNPPVQEPNPPVQPPVEPPVEPPVNPPTTPIAPPVNPPVQQPESPISPPVTPPVSEPVSTPPVATPVGLNGTTGLEPSSNPLFGNDHRVDIIIGVSIGVVSVALVAVSWWRCTVQKRNRYRAIG